MNDFSRRVGTLSEAKRLLLELRLKEKSRDRRQSPQALTINRADRSGSLPLSFAQQRLWLIHQLDPTSCAYNIQATVRMEGPLNASLLEQSLNRVISRHESLRTSFSLAKGQLLQVIAGPEPVNISAIDLSTMPEAEREGYARRIASEQARHAFDLAEAPLLRASLIKLAEQDHIFSLTMHHIISDGWSMGILLREMVSFYNAYSSRQSPPVANLPIQYVDYAQWQRQWMRGEALAAELDYWKKKLEGAATTLELPTSKPRPPFQSFKGRVESFTLSQAFADKLRAFCRTEGVTLFMLLLAAFKLLLYRYTMREEIVVGSPVANRNRPGVEQLIGLFINTIILRTDLSGDPTFRDLLRRVREVVHEATAHQDLPFEKLVEELQPEREMSRNLLFQVMFVLQSNPMEGLALAGLKLSFIETHNGTAKRDLTLTMVDAGPELSGAFEYNSDLFEPSSVALMAGHFRALMEGVVANADRRIWELPLLTETELHQLSLEASRNRAEYPAGQCLQEAFALQVEKTPDAMALAFEGAELTFEELNRRANQLAHYLKRLGAGRGAAVGICVTRSLEMVVGLWAVLKAGGAYVPMGPAYPKERISYTLKDANISVLLTQQSLLDNLPATAAKLVCLDSDWNHVAQESRENFLSGAEPEDAAYILYTSGSTGRPKGVVVEHRQVLNYVRGVMDRLNLSAGASFAMVQPLTVDSCVTVIYPPMITGGCLHLISQERAASPDLLGEYFDRHRIDCLKIAPSHLAALLGSARPAQVLPERWLIIGGEASHWDWVMRLKSLATGCAIFNHYGPTEATVGVTTYSIKDGQSGDRPATVPIGRALPNSEIHILDSHLQRAPAGVPGQLYIGGASLARGYLNRQELTAEKFIPDPFSDRPGGRLYQTGDLARYLPDGNVEFLGRIDHQVKIRGYRIELGEIEAVIARHPRVKEAVVLASQERGNNRLVAYITVDAGHSPTDSDLREFLRDELPDYMLPSLFIRLDALPRTPHGKLDVRALPAPGGHRPELRTAYATPRTDIERKIAGIWKELLQLEQVGIDDNFFDLGGHSLLMVRLHSRLKEMFDTQLPIIELFKYPTISSCAEYLTRQPTRTNSLQESIDRGQRQIGALKRRQHLKKASQELQ